jgi:hypothetical protein
VGLCLAHVRTQRLHPGPVGGGAARLPAAADQDPRAARPGARDQLLGQAALADARLAHQQEQPPTAGEGVVEAADQLAQLALAAHKRAARGLHCRLGRPRPGRHHEPESRVLGQDRQLQLAQPLARLDAELLD